MWSAISFRFSGAYDETRERLVYRKEREITSLEGKTGGRHRSSRSKLENNVTMTENLAQSKEQISRVLRDFAELKDSILVCEELALFPSGHEYFAELVDFRGRFEPHAILSSVEEDPLSLRGKKRFSGKENQVGACIVGVSSLERRSVVDREKRSLLGELVDADLMSIVGLMLVATIEAES